MKPNCIFIVSLMVLIELLMGVIAVNAGGNDFVVGDLRVDLPEIYNAQNYQVTLMAIDKPSTGDRRNFSAAWLGFFLAEYNGGVGSGKFAQVGLLASRDGLQWFVYAESDVTCLRGTQPAGDPHHCYGDYDDLVSIKQWNRFHMSKDTVNSFWTAYVYDTAGNPYSVAAIHEDSNVIYLARSDTEEGYYEDNDPYIQMSFYHWHPQYYKDFTWEEWPQSLGGISEIWTSPPSICPIHYGATPNYSGDVRAWYAGTGGEVCHWLLFPAHWVYLPLTIKVS